MNDGSAIPDPHVIRDVATLERLYGTPTETSLVKEADHIHPVYRPFIEAAPFFVLATNGESRLDTSPRGDAAGFVVVEDAHTLLVPDRRGNNRIDSLRNILHDPRVALLFLIPGVGETLRVNGRAELSVDPALLARFAVDGKEPRSVMVVKVDLVFFQCSRAIVRSQLWDPAKQIPRSALPSGGRILATLSADRVGGDEYDAALPARLKATLY